MSKKIYRPHDCKKMTDRYLIDGGGICGQSCIASIMNTSINWVLKEWKNIGLEWKGWSTWYQLKYFLKNQGYIVKQEKANIRYLKGYWYIARVQWKGDGKKQEKPFYGYDHWSKATANTHFISLTKDMFLCNHDGLFRIGHLEPYLKFHKGVITSHLRISIENE